MSLFKKEQVATTATTAPAAGTMQLTKGNRLQLTKTGAPILAKNGWTAEGKDYDLKALVRYRDGRTLYVGAANRDEVLSSPEGAVVHGGDARKAGELETISIKWNPTIASVALSSYSALENGTGSFRQYGVYVEIVNGPQVVRISAADASAKGTSYTLCFGEVIFEQNGSLTIVNHEMYSEGGSENRIGYQGDKVVMDIGPKGQTK
jgi:tellurium resistance protein TerD